MPSPVIEMPKIDPKIFENVNAPVGLKGFEAKHLAKNGGGGPPPWLRWECAIGVLVAAALVGLLQALFRRNAT
jgi:hypothetical protein